MIISSLNPKAKKQLCSTRKCQNTANPNTISFRGAGYLKPELAGSISSLVRAYGDILNSLSKKTDEGIAHIEKEFGSFEYGRSMTFHDCGQNKTSISVRVPEGKTGRNLIKIVVKKGKNYPDDKIFLNSFTISDYNRLLKDEQPNKAYVFPEKMEYLSNDELINTKSESNLENVVDDLDFEMLKMRKLLNKMSGQFLKPETYRLNGENLKLFENIDKLYEDSDKFLKTLSHKLSIKLRTDYGDYKLQAKQPTHILTNIGDEKYKIVYKKLENPEHGPLVRLMIYNSDDEVVDGFLIDKNNRIVSNFNTEYFNIIPPKLTFYDKQSVEKILPRFEKYLDLYEKKLTDFNEFLNKKVYERTLKPVVGTIQGETFDKLANIHAIYDNLSEKFSAINPAALSNLKTSYPKWAAAGGQRGFVFKMQDDGILSIVKMNAGKENKLLRLRFSNNGDVKYFLINNDRVVKNFNPKYPQMLPPVLKYYDDIELEEAGIEPFIAKAAEEMDEFKKYIDNPPQKPVKNKQNPVQRKVKKSAEISGSDDYQKLIKDCRIKFEDALKNAENNLENFNKVLSDIQQKVNAFFEKK